MLLIFEVLTTARMKMVVFWVVAHCFLVEVYRWARGDCRLHHHDTYKNVRNNPEHGHLHE